MKWFSVSAWLLLALSMLGCQSMAQSKTIGAGARVVNTVPGMTIVHARFNGQGMGGGGGEECCVSLPEQWRPGMTATIEWVKDPSPGVNPGGIKQPPRGKYGSITAEGSKWYEEHEANYVRRKVTMAVPKYEKVSSLVLVFLPCDEVYPLIDSAEQSRVFGGLRGKSSQGWDDEVIRRLGGKTKCLR
ncbi:DUF3304 domain-containing protein [Chromobacterium haemolyticum]|uniref:DUF3304 domain-containing protein n=1 Tax=Chromobacterium TaxID=535 RepID=UPI0040573DA9